MPGLAGYIGTAEAAEIRHCKQITMTKWCRLGWFKHVKKINRNTYMVLESEVRDLETYPNRRPGRKPSAKQQRRRLRTNSRAASKSDSAPPASPV